MAQQGGNLQEAAAFLWMICYGLACGFLFDLLAFLRRLLRPGGLSSFFIDLFYCILIGAGFLLFLYAGWHGEMRLYWVLGAALGFGTYHAGPGRSVRRLFFKWAHALRRCTGRIVRNAEEALNVFSQKNRRRLEEAMAKRRQRAEKNREQRLARKQQTQSRRIQKRKSGTG